MSIPFSRSTEISAIEVVYKTCFAAHADRRRQRRRCFQLQFMGRAFRSEALGQQPRLPCSWPFRSSLPLCHSAKFWRNIKGRQLPTQTEAGVTSSKTLELICRLFVGLFVGFFCVTAVLFVHYISADTRSQVSVVRSKSASPALLGSAPAVPFSSASEHRQSTPSLDSEERTLIASSASTLVAFIAVAVTSFLSWRKGKTNTTKENRNASG
ncbi:hypothetical protein BSCH_01479c [Candidatus Paraburkholderia schumanniana]|nr:hypothetical protein BSCH_01479c [Candidatus Paraburkholderia schumannianae]